VTHDHARWSHRHDFDAGNPAGERVTRWVVWITLVAMVVEIAAGWWFGSMALLADGWHMGTHALAIGLSVLAYAAARRFASDTRFAFGSWKIEVLGAFASAVLLAGAGLLMIIASIERLLSPQPIMYREAIAVAVVGLLINLACARLLGSGAHASHHGHHHGHAAHGEQHHADDANGHGHADAQAGAAAAPDLNLRSAYLHVITDALTSVLAILALLGGWLYGWAWLDPLMGILGALLIIAWARTLILQSATVLLDREMDHPLVATIRETIEQHGAAGVHRVIDLHVWRVGRNAFACAVTVVSHDEAIDAAAVRRWLEPLDLLAHATVEVHYCGQ